ncbi:hypothetical protein D3C84_863670 [compost metagenome]
MGFKNCVPLRIGSCRLSSVRIGPGNRYARLFSQHTDRFWEGVAFNLFHKPDDIPRLAAAVTMKNLEFRRYGKRRGLLGVEGTKPLHVFAVL